MRRQKHERFCMTAIGTGTVILFLVLSPLKFLVLSAGALLIIIGIAKLFKHC